MRWALVYTAGFVTPVILALMLFPEHVAGFVNAEAEFVAIGAAWRVIAPFGWYSSSRTASPAGGRTRACYNGRARCAMLLLSSDFTKVSLRINGA